MTPQTIWRLKRGPFNIKKKKIRRGSDKVIDENIRGSYKCDRSFSTSEIKMAVGCDIGSTAHV